MARTKNSIKRFYSFIFLIASFAILVGFSTSLHATETTWARTPDALEMGMLLSAKAAGNLQNTIETLSTYFLYRDYEVSPTGDGPDSTIDKRPFFNSQGLDCTTYVEAVMALYRAQSLNDFVQHLVAIKYRNSQVDYQYRNHFPEADWIPNNIQAGYLRDITREILPEAPVAHTIVRKRAWAETDAIPNTFSPEEREIRKHEIKQIAHEFPEEVDANLAYVPFAKLFNGDKIDPELAEKIPSGTVFNLVHENLKLAQSRSGLLVSHQGFLIWKPNEKGERQLYVRHATSRSVGKDQVPYLRDETFENAMLRYKNHGSVKGLNLLEILPGAGLP